MAEVATAAEVKIVQKVIQEAARSLAPAPALRHDPISRSLVLARNPQNEEGWRQICQMIWLDATQIFAHDPFWLASPQPHTWERFHYFLTSREDRLLSRLETQQSTLVQVPEQSFGVQMLVRRGAGKMPHQDFVQVFALGATRQWAVIAGSLEDDPKAFFLWRLPIAMPEKTQCNIMASKKSTIVGTQVGKQLDGEMAFAIEEVRPLWEIVEDSRLPGAPFLGALCPESGMAAVICENKPDRVHRFQIDTQTRTGQDLPWGRPSGLYVSGTHAAVTYMGGVPHVRLGPWGNHNEWKIYVPQISETPDKDGKLPFHKMTTAVFHRALPHLLLVGTDKGQILLVDGNTAKLSRPPYVPVDPAAFAEEMKRVAAQSQDPEKVLREARSPEQPLCSIQWGAVGPEGAREPRLLLCYEQALGYVNGSPESQALQQSFGQQPRAFARSASTMMWAEAYGGLLVTFDWATCEVSLGYLPKMQPRSKWSLDHELAKDLQGVQQLPYPALALFSERVVIVYPNGAVGFIELMSDEDKVAYKEALEEKLREQQEKLLLERLKKLSVEAANTEAAAAKAAANPPRHL